MMKEQLEVGVGGGAGKEYHSGQLLGENRAENRSLGNPNTFKRQQPQTYNT